MTDLATKYIWASGWGKRKKTAPGPRGSLVMGNLKAYIEDPVMMLMDLRNGYGDIVRNRLGPFLTHAIAHPDYIEHVLQDNHRNYCRGKFYDNFKLIFGDGVLTTDGDFWRQHRRIVQPAFQKVHIENGMAIAGRQVEELAERWRALASDSPVDVIPEMMRVSLGALGEMMFKTDISQYHEEVGPHVRFAIRCMMPQGDMNDFLPRSWPTPFNISTRRAKAGIDKVIDKVIDDHRAAFSEGAAVDDSDIIALLLAARNPDTGGPLTPQEIHDEVATVFLAGHETTGSGLGWLLYALAQYPAVLLRLREELDSVLGGRAPAPEDLPRLPYLEAVVSETLRVYPPIWTYTRDLIEDDEIGGYHIPAGSSIFLSPYVVHRHPAFWSNPEAFDPENFGSGAPTRHKYAYFPFGGGMRKCIGYQVATVMMRALAAIAAQHFDFALKPGHEFKRGALISLRPSNGLPLVIRPRASNGLRPSPNGGGSSSTARSAANSAAQTQRESRCPFSGAAEARTGEAKDEEPAPAAKTLDWAPEGDVKRIAMSPQDRPLPPQRWSAMVGKRVLIVNGGPVARERLEFSLAREFVHTRVFDSASEADEAALQAAVNALEAQAGGFDAVVDLGMIGAPAMECDWESPMRRTVAALKAVYPAWAQETRADRLFYLCVTAMDGVLGVAGEGVGQPLGGLWAGLAKSLPQEMPNCNVRVVDLAPDEIDRLADRVCDELWRDTAIEIGYRAQTRYSLQPIFATLPDRPEIFAAGPGDAVLFSGGARGIGLLCAEAFGRATGAEVILTGREPPAEGDEAWAQIDDDAFKVWARAELVRASSTGETVAAIRRRTETLARRRAARRNLEKLVAAGVKATYQVCDVTDRDAVAALCRSLGDRLVMIVHNAGVDRPTRLPRKSAQEFVDVIRVKIKGFQNLVDASRGNRRLRRVLSFGSLTGRWGGMTGEIDYAAANEGLSRLTLHAPSTRPGVVFRSLVWPTWEEVGMITNYEVTKRYVSPMSVAEGVRYFLAETGAPESGEAVFMGAVGDAVTPIQLLGYPPLPGLAGVDTLLTRRHHVGRPRDFRPYVSIATDYDVDPRRLDLRSILRRNTEGFLLAALVMEHALQAAYWARSEDSAPLKLVRADRITVDVGACRRAGLQRPVGLSTRVAGARKGNEWRAEITVTERDSDEEWMRLVASFAEQTEDLAVRPAEGRSATIKTLRAQDIWIDPMPPRLLLPLGHLMQILEDISRQASLVALPALTLGAAEAENAEPILISTQDRGLVFDRDGRLVMDVALPVGAPAEAELELL